MEFFINELSLEEQFAFRENFTDSIITFIRLLSSIKDELQTDPIYKDKYLIYRKAVQGEILQKTLNHIRNKDIRDAFRQVFQRGRIKDWQNDQKHHAEIIYYCPDIKNKIVSNSSVAEAAKRKLLEPIIERILLNFTPSCFNKYDNNSLIVRKKSQAGETHISLLGLEKFTDLKNFYNFEAEPLDNYLRDKARFIKTALIIQKHSVYKEIGTGRIWYLDSLHETHFEVFTKEIRHIGEADFSGSINIKKRDPKKDKTFML